MDNYYYYIRQQAPHLQRNARLVTRQHSMVLGQSVAAQQSDCNSMDYFAWNVFERDVNKHLQSSSDSLRQNIIDVTRNLSSDMLAKAFQRFRYKSNATKLARNYTRNEKCIYHFLFTITISICWKNIADLAHATCTVLSAV